MYNKEEVMKAFDEQFGKAGPNKNSDSIGREAGCDDCSTSIKVREETRDFLSTALDAAFKAGEEEMEKPLREALRMLDDEIPYTNEEVIMKIKEALK